jgi:hypothetical protein
MEPEAPPPISPTSAFNKKPPPPGTNLRRRWSDVTWPRVIIVLGLAALGVVAALAKLDWLAGMLVGGALGSNMPITKGDPNARH